MAKKINSTSRVVHKQTEGKVNGQVPRMKNPPPPPSKKK